MPWATEMLLQRKAVGRRVADAELQLGGRRNRAVAEIAAGLGAMARGQRIGEEFAARSITSYSVLRRCSWRAASGVAAGSAIPAIAASRSTASAKPTPSVSIKNEMMSPCLPEEKSW